MLFLGFTDDVLNWPWRYKLVLPTVASLPLLCCYSGSTNIVVPIQLRTWIVSPTTDSDTTDYELTWLGQLASLLCVQIDTSLQGKIIDLGFYYLVYMGMLAVFCTNAINIYAGINGLEAGQAYVMACFVLLHNAIEIHLGGNVSNHLLSIMMMLPFASVTLGLLKYNWFPASVFVGDTYCYFAGMTFAVVGILGHFSKTLLLFFLPQIANFLWSFPQLLHVVPCPRHRLPKYNAVLGKMVPSTFPCREDQFRSLKRKPTDTECPNMTVINLCLQILGPMEEQTLCVTLLGLQVASCVFGLFVRYYVAQFFFDE